MLHPNFSSFPDFITERLTLRQVFPSDVNEIFFLRSDQTVLKFINKQPIELTEEALQWIEKITLGQQHGDCINWGICLTGNPKLIGNICLWRISWENKKAELGYALHPAFHKKGIMQEALT